MLFRKPCCQRTVLLENRVSGRLPVFEEMAKSIWKFLNNVFGLRIKLYFVYKRRIRIVEMYGSVKFQQFSFMFPGRKSYMHVKSNVCTTVFPAEIVYTSMRVTQQLCATMYQRIFNIYLLGVGLGPNNYVHYKLNSSNLIYSKQTWL